MSCVPLINQAFWKKCFIIVHSCSWPNKEWNMITYCSAGTLTYCMRYTPTRYTATTLLLLILWFTHPEKTLTPATYPLWRPCSSASHPWAQVDGTIASSGGTPATHSFTAQDDCVHPLDIHYSEHNGSELLIHHHVLDHKTSFSPHGNGSLQFLCPHTTACISALIFCTKTTPTHFVAPTPDL